MGGLDTRWNRFEKSDGFMRRGYRRLSWRRGSVVQSQRSNVFLGMKLGRGFKLYQQLTLIGHLGNDPELRHTPSGVPVASFSLAVNRTWTNPEGERQDKTTWFRVTTWRKQAELVNQYLQKGSKVLVVGEIEEARPYTDRDGNQRASLEVNAHNVRFLSGQGEREDGAPARSSNSSKGSNQRTERHELRDEDIPF